jgi:hypothetical protein
MAKTRTESLPQNQSPAAPLGSARPCPTACEKGGLITAIDRYVDRHNECPKPFIWTASASDILESVKRARKALLKGQSA